MPAELDQMNPEMGQIDSPEMDQEAHDYSAPDGGHDREGAMAKADLYKLATYSHKLFKQLHDNDQMEAWVQAKITKAADYIASVYHYLEYEMKFSEYGHHLDNSDTLSEGQKMKFQEILAEAKDKMKDLKKSQAEKMKSKKVEEGVLSGGERACTECNGTGMVYEEPMPVPDHVKGKVAKYNTMMKATKAAHKRMDANKNGIPDDEEMDEEFDDKSKVGDTFKTKTGVATKTDRGVKHTNTSYKDDGEAEEKSGKGIKSHAKAQSAAEKKEKAPAQKMSPKSAKTWGMKDSEKFDNRDKPKDESVAEGKKKGDGNLANNAKPYDKVTRGDVIAGRLGKDEKGGKDVKEAAKPSAGLSKAKKSATVKDAKAGKDIGKPGKGFDKLAKKAGGGEKGQKIAAAAMWKNMKETTAYMAEKKAMEKVSKDKKAGEGNAFSGALKKAREEGDTKMTVDGKSVPVKPGQAIAESTDLDRMRVLMQRLNG
jgi:hypothetical protein